MVYESYSFFLFLYYYQLSNLRKAKINSICYGFILSILYLGVFELYLVFGGDGIWEGS